MAKSATDLESGRFGVAGICGATSELSASKAGVAPVTAPAPAIGGTVSPRAKVG